REGELLKKIHILQKRLHRREKTIKTTQNIIETLKTNHEHNTDLEKILLNNFSDSKLQIILNEYHNNNVVSTQRRYTQEMKQFALTLYFYSPKGYDTLRETLCLPHPSMLRKWLGNYNCEVGFLSEIFKYLETEIPQKQFLKDVALIFDSMAIRTQIIHDIKTDKNRGYVDYGDILNIDSQDLATEVLVFQIVSYTNKFKCPIAYFFINKINANMQAQLIKCAIEKLYEVGVIVRSLTCDGTKTNLSTFKLLGCNLSTDNMKTFFEHPQNKSNVYCIMDPCHMVKLARNALAETNISSKAGLISFSYIKKLHTIQEEADLKLANKLSYNHVNFSNKKMNVRLAAQVLSSSVADAIDFLRTSGDKNSINSEATTE
ncbi:THAP domain-containing protein 9, partial [Camponotus floridanus]